MDFICELAEVKFKPRRQHVVPCQSPIQVLARRTELNFAHRKDRRTYGILIMDWYLKIQLVNCLPFAFQFRLFPCFA